MRPFIFIIFDKIGNNHNVQRIENSFFSGFHMFKMRE